MRPRTLGWLLLSTAGLAIVLVSAPGFRAQSRALTVAVTGQVAIHSDFRVHSPSVVTNIAPLLKGSDVVVGNLETTIGTPDEKVLRSPHGNHTPPEALDALIALGFNMLPLANNHSLDMGVSGLHSTIAELKRRKLTSAGTGATLKEAAAPSYRSTRNGTVALVAFASGYFGGGGCVRPEAGATETRPGLNEIRVQQVTAAGRPPDIKPNDDDAQRILQSIRDAAQHADLVITHQHNHVNDPATLCFSTAEFEDLSPKRWVPPDWIKRWTHAQVDAGADVVFLTGSPVMQGVEIYRNRPIFYDLGNFMFNCPGCTLAADTGGRSSWMENDPSVFESIVATIEFQQKNVRSVKFRPIVMSQKGRDDTQYRPDEDQHSSLWTATRGLPVPATGEKARVILNRLAELSWPFGTWVEVTGETAEIRLR